MSDNLAAGNQTSSWTDAEIMKGRGTVRTSFQNVSKKTSLCAVGAGGYVDEDGKGVGKAVGDPTRVFDDHVVFNTDPTNRLGGKGASAQVDWKTAIGTITSITADRKQTNASTQEIVASVAALSDHSDKLSRLTEQLDLAR